jgi:hypothetical protein
MPDIAFGPAAEGGVTTMMSVGADDPTYQPNRLLEAGLAGAGVVLIVGVLTENKPLRNVGLAAELALLVVKLLGMR